MVVEPKVKSTNSHVKKANYNGFFCSIYHTVIYLLKLMTHSTKYDNKKRSDSMDLR